MKIEQAATDIRVFQPTVIPGLLQTAAYARRMLIGSTTATDRELGAAVENRMARKALLYNPNRTFRFVVTENALRTSYVDPAATLDQLKHLRDLAALPNVHFGVIPIGAALVHPPWTGFTIYDHTQAYAETFFALVGAVNPEDVAAYLERFNEYWAASATEAAAATIIHAVEHDLPHDSEPSRSSRPS